MFATGEANLAEYANATAGVSKVLPLKWKKSSKQDPPTVEVEKREIERKKAKVMISKIKGEEGGKRYFECREEGKREKGDKEREGERSLYLAISLSSCINFFFSIVQNHE